MTLGKVQVGCPAPEFTCTAVVDGRLKEVSSRCYSEANHWLILIFFPKAWSFICPTEIKAFSARLEEFLYSRSCAVVFASTDSEHCLKAWNATSDLEGGLGGVHVPLISDCGHKLSRDYGVLIEETGVAQRALFIIDSKGMVRSITINDADVGRSVDECLRVIDALAFKDEFGEGCPVDWKKGDKGIDIASKTRVEGTVELKKSWSEWARPKLNRAWSNTSGRSISSNLAATLGNGRLRAESNDRLTPLGFTGVPSGYTTGLSSGQQSPAFSPTSNGPPSPAFSPTSNMSMEALMQQRMENMQAALQI
ncbi:cTPxI [Vermiconidia calcicola]|uniref:CTPxI n=1 Tax=Vermiconidia calcicola TaxID=1690605 RepID=A0ACC3NFC6_9PEZI|nr:cTPxI [Vermiconidia calcicola]